MKKFRTFDFTDSSHGQDSTSRMCHLSRPWKFLTISAGVFLFFLCIFFGGFYAGRTSAINSLVEGIDAVVEDNTTTTVESTTAEGKNWNTTTTLESTTAVSKNWNTTTTLESTTAVSKNWNTTTTLEFTTAQIPEIEWDGMCPRRSGICPTSYRNNPLLLLVSMDGFRPDYLERGFTPTLYNISRCGTRAPFMYPVFPSKTFPNHYSQVTGLNPVSHGIIDNTMYEPSTRKVFKLGTPEASKPYWWSSEPIWVTSEKQGKKAGCFFWPGSDVKINSTFPTYYRKYSAKIPFATRVQTVLSWMDKPVVDRPSFFTLYVNQPDHAAHANGTKSDSVNEQLKRVDDMISMLFAGLQEREILDCVNVILVSDHGMADTSCDRIVALNDFINISEVYTVAGPFGRIRVKGTKNITAEQSVLESLQCTKPQMRAYRKENLPLRYHYSSNPRIEPLFLDIDAGWMISNYGTQPNNPFCMGGNHGYDNLFPDMRALFMAIGPSFKSNHTVEPFINTELYELMTELLNVTARPNNGTKGSLHHLLNDPQTLPPQPKYSPPLVLKVPSDQLVIEMNFQAAECNGSKLTENLKMTALEINQSRSYHVPFGIPHCQFDCDSWRLLYHSDYISAFDVKYKIPLWTAYTISRKADLNEEQELEWTADVRIPFRDEATCTFYKDPKVVDKDIQQRPQFPPGFASDGGNRTASLVTNSVPKTRDYVTLIEKAFNDMLSEWAEQEGSINVITGPAFDVLNTGVYPGVGSIMEIHAKYGPLVVPTHYYAVITWCKTAALNVSDCEPSNLDVVAFLLPNDPVPNNCESSKDLIAKNAARVVDVENLSGISFFTELPIYDAIRLRTAIPKRQLMS